MNFTIYKTHVKKEQWELCTKGTQAAANTEAYITRILGKELYTPGHKPTLQDNKATKTRNRR